MDNHFNLLFIDIHLLCCQKSDKLLQFLLLLHRVHELCTDHSSTRYFALSLCSRIAMQKEKRMEEKFFALNRDHAQV